MKRYPTIAGMTPSQIGFEAERECECRPDLPDGRSFPMCIPCKVRQDLARYEEDLRMSLCDIDLTDDDDRDADDWYDDLLYWDDWDDGDIPFLF